MHEGRLIHSTRKLLFLSTLLNLPTPMILTINLKQICQNKILILDTVVLSQVAEVVATVAMLPSNAKSVIGMVTLLRCASTALKKTTLQLLLLISLELHPLKLPLLPTIILGSQLLEPLLH